MFPRNLSLGLSPVIDGPINFNIWQGTVSPHMSGLARSLAVTGANVTYIAKEPISAHRALMGWSAPMLPGVRVELLQGEDGVALAASFPADTIHITQGVRRNGYIRRVASRLAGIRARWGALMEKVDDRGVRGFLKRLDYTYALRGSGPRPDFILAVGERMPEWLRARGFPPDRVFPFAYFLEPQPTPLRARPEGAYRIGFVGQLIRRKRVDVLIDALSLSSARDFELIIVGDGPLERTLRRRSEGRLGASCTRWLGALSMANARAEIASLDCLVLPSDHDGWGAVVSEALIAGVPAVCSEACGVSAVVRASGYGGVFATGDAQALRALLEHMVERGSLTEGSRAALARWAQCLSVEAGAQYLNRIAAAVYQSGVRPAPPWESTAINR
jgi:glycosyltransferase involved in cell wall biosynthesis